MTKPKLTRWVHGFDNWEWDKHHEVWYHHVPSGRSYWCLGDRMFHEAYGVTLADRCYHGSYTDNWHGGIQTRNFMEAILWLYNADGKGHELW